MLLNDGAKLNMWQTNNESEHAFKLLTTLIKLHIMRLSTHVWIPLAFWNLFCFASPFKHAKIRGVAKSPEGDGSTAAGLSGWNGSTAAWIHSSAGLCAACAGSSGVTDAARVRYRAVRAGDGAGLSDGDAAHFTKYSNPAFYNILQ